MLILVLIIEENWGGGSLLMLTLVFDVDVNRVGGKLLVLIWTFDIDPTQSGDNSLLIILTNRTLRRRLFRTRRPMTRVSAWTPTQTI